MHKQYISKSFGNDSTFLSYRSGTPQERTCATCHCEHPASSIPMFLFIWCSLRWRQTCRSAAIPYVNFNENLTIAQAKTCYMYKCQWKQMVMNNNIHGCVLPRASPVTFTCQINTFMSCENQFIFGSNLIYIHVVIILTKYWRISNGRKNRKMGWNKYITSSATNSNNCFTVFFLIFGDRCMKLFVVFYPNLIVLCLSSFLVKMFLKLGYVF